MYLASDAELRDKNIDFTPALLRKMRGMLRIVQPWIERLPAHLWVLGDGKAWPVDSPEGRGLLRLPPAVKSALRIEAAGDFVNAPKIGMFPPFELYVGEGKDMASLGPGFQIAIYIG